MTLVGWWRFEERITSNTGKAIALDSSGYDRHATVNTGTAVWSTGRIGNAGFSSTGAVQMVANCNPALTNATNFTISAWMKRANTADTVSLGQGNTGAGYESMELWSDDKAYFEVSGPASPSYVSTTVAGTDWHHLVLAYDGSQASSITKVKAYVDGTLRATTNTGTVPSSSSNNGSLPFEIGCYLNGANFMTGGSIDDVRIYDRTLSGKEIARVYARTAIGKVTTYLPDINSGLVSWYRFYEGSGTTAKDYMGGNHGTLGGSPVPSWVTGRTTGSYALDFSGATTTRLSIASVAALVLRNAVSATAWIQTSSSSTSQCEIVNRWGTDNSWSLSMNLGTGNIRWNLSGLVDCRVNSVTPNDGEWHHVVGTYDGNLAKVYFDGVLVHSEGGYGLMNSTIYSLYIGNNDSWASNFPGLIGGDVRIYNRALTAAEVARIYASPVVRSET